MSERYCKLCCHITADDTKELCYNCGRPLPPSPLTAVQPLLDALEAERGKVYGDPHESHTNIGLAWTGLIQQHYGIRLSHPLPPELVALMMVDFKASRSTRVYKQDNYDDMKVYAGFAERFQRPPAPLTSATAPDVVETPVGCSDCGGVHFHTEFCRHYRR